MFSIHTSAMTAAFALQPAPDKHGTTGEAGFQTAPQIRRSFRDRCPGWVLHRLCRLPWFPARGISGESSHAVTVHGILALIEGLSDLHLTARSVNSYGFGVFLADRFLGTVVPGRCPMSRPLDAPLILNFGLHTVQI